MKEDVTYQFNSAFFRAGNASVIEQMNHVRIESSREDEQRIKVVVSPVSDDVLESSTQFRRQLLRDVAETIVLVRILKLISEGLSN